MEPGYKDESIELYLGDCQVSLGSLADNSIDITVTSPPYDNLRTYNGYSWDFEAIARELFRVTKDGGVVCWNVGDSVVDGSETLTSFRQALYFKDVCGFRVHDTMIYNRLSFNNPERVRYHQVFEYVFVLGKGQPSTFNPIKDKPNKWAGKTAFGQTTVRAANGDMQLRAKKVYDDFGMRGNVWLGKTRGQEEICQSQEHPALMPKWLARDLITSWSNEGDSVLDPFMGGATTGIQSINLKRRFIGMEIDETYFNQCKVELLAKREALANEPLELFS